MSTVDCETLVMYLLLTQEICNNCKAKPSDVRPLDLIHIFFISILTWLSVAYDHHSIRIKFSLAKSEIMINDLIVRQYNRGFGHSEQFGAEC